MKKVFLLLVSILTVEMAFASSTPPTNYGYDSSIIFHEANIEFAVYPNGEFDFYLPKHNQINIQQIGSHTTITFNTGYNYNPFVQYDDYGAVIQIENIPIYYDYYGRIIRAGNTFIHYNNYGRLTRVGGLYIYYDVLGNFHHFRGYINNYNRRYIPHSWHKYYRKPLPSKTVVYVQPYRTYYRPQRVAYNTYRRNYAERTSSPVFHRPEERITNYTRGSKTQEKQELAYNNKDYNRGNIRNTRAIRQRNLDHKELSTIENIPTRRNNSKVRSSSANNNKNIRNNPVMRKPSEVNSRTSRHINNSSARSSSTSRRE